MPNDLTDLSNAALRALEMDAENYNPTLRCAVKSAVAEIRRLRTEATAQPERVVVRHAERHADTFSDRTVQCDGCKIVGRRPMMHPAPREWSFAAIDIAGTHETIFVYACSPACRESLWKSGPGERFTPEEIASVAPQSAPAPPPVYALDPQAAMGEGRACRNYSPWGCDRDEEGRRVHPAWCSVCGGTKAQHTKDVPDVG